MIVCGDVKTTGLSPDKDYLIEPAHPMLRTLPPDELAAFQTASPEEVAHALRRGELEARMMFPRSGENVEQLRREHEELMASAPMRGVVRR